MKYTALLKKVAKEESFQQFIKYILVGIVGLVIELGSYYLLVDTFSVHYPFALFISDLFGGKMSVAMTDIDISHIISALLGVINNFLLNSYYTFKVTDKKWRRFASYFAVAIFGIVASTALITLFIGVLNINIFIAKILAVGIVAMLQFVLNKFLTFKNKTVKE